MIGATGAMVAAAAQAGTPGRGDFAFEGVYLDAAFTHPLGNFAASALARYVDARLRDPQAIGPRDNPRRDAVARFARLINAEPGDIAVVPSTLDGENLVNAALQIGPGAGVVTDALHYDASLALYGELARRGAPVAVVRPRNGRIELADLRAQLSPQTRLISVSLVSSATGFQHDLTELCAIAHARDVLVYADIIQAAGAMPIDVRATGVDFACAGTYKWLMGEFGAAFLYVRPDRLERLRRPQVGWRQAEEAAGVFEVSTPAWSALAVASASLDYIQAIGVDAIARRRQPLIDRLRQGLARPGFTPLTPPEAQGPILAYAVREASARFDARLRAAGIRISTYKDRLRISPSVYNDLDDVERLLGVLTA